MVENSKAEIIAPAFPLTEALSRSLGALSRGEHHEPFYAESKEILTLEQKVAAHFGTETAIVLSCGMAAVDAAVRIVCQEKIKQLEESGKPMSEWSTFHFIVGEHLYFHSGVIFDEIAKLYRTEATVVNPTDLKQVEKAKQDNTIGIFFETTSNSFAMGVVPEMRKFEEILGPEVKIIADISLSPNRKVAKEAANKNNLILVLSGTKDPSAGEVMAGFLCGGKHLNPHRVTIRAAGQNFTPDKPIEPLLKGLGSLDERFNTASYNAQMFAKRLQVYAQEHPNIIRHVSYPGLEDHPQHDLVEKLLAGNAGGILFVDFGSEERAAAFVNLVARTSELETEQGHKAIIATSFGTAATRLFPQAVVLPPEMKGIVRIAAGSERLKWTKGIDEFFERVGKVLKRGKERLYLKTLEKE